jgi:hypothetical protein
MHVLRRSFFSGNRVLNQTATRENEIVATAPSQLMVNPPVGLLFLYDCNDVI